MHLSALGSVLVDLDTNANGTVSNFAVRGNANTLTMFKVYESGLCVIGDDTNANMTMGLTINQGANDNQIFALKSSDVGHGMLSNGLTNAETDDFLSIRKRDANGGAHIGAFMNNGGGNRVLNFSAAGGTPDQTDTASSQAMVLFNILLHDDSDTRVNLADTDNAFAVNTHNGGGFGTRLLIKGNGTIHVTNTTLVALDDQPDALVVRAMQKASSHSGIVEGEFDNPFYNYDFLRSKGLVGDIDPDGDGTFLFPIQNRFAAHEGAIWQNYVLGKSVEQKHMSLAEKVDGLEVELIAAKKQLAAISA